MSVEQQKPAAELGAFLEYPLGTAPGRYTLWGVSEKEKFCGYFEAIRAIGPEHVIISNDLRQPLNPIHTDGMKAYLGKLLAAGFTQTQIDWMSKRNPARLLGIREENQCELKVY